MSEGAPTVTGMTENLTPDGVPVFGRGADHTSTINFAIEIFDAAEGTTDDVEFAAYRDIGSGPFIAFLQAARQGGDAMITGAAGLLLRATIDSDGLSADYLKPADGSDIDERYDDIPQWSSKRRFMYYVNSERFHIGRDVLPELAQWIMKQAAGRPTKASTVGASPKASSSGRTPTRRGSTASRSRKAST